MYFQMNYASFCGAMMAAFVLDLMLINTAFKSVIDLHSGRALGNMIWGVISFHGLFNLLQIESNFNSNRYVREVLQPEIVPFLQGILGAIIQQDSARLHVAKTVRDFCSAKHKQRIH